MPPSATLDPHGAQTLGQPAISLTAGENTFSVAIGATLRMVRRAPRRSLSNNGRSGWGGQVVDQAEDIQNQARHGGSRTAWWGTSDQR